MCLSRVVKAKDVCEGLILKYILDCHVAPAPRNDTKPGVTPRPITALTSQVGEVAVVRALASYKCGWGSDNKKLTPSLTLPTGEGARVVVQLAHSPLPQKITSLRG